MLVRRPTSILSATLALTSHGSCVYLRLLRPSVVKQMRPDMARLVAYRPRLDHPQDAIVGRLVATSSFTFSEYSI